MSRAIILGNGNTAQLRHDGADLYFVTVGHPRPLADGYGAGRLYQSGASSSHYVGPADPHEAYALIQGDNGTLYVETPTKQAFVSYTAGQTWELAYTPEQLPTR